MTSVTIIQNTAAPSHQAVAAKSRSKPFRVTGKLKLACDYMVWGDENGNVMAYDEAARAADMTVRAMRKALDRQHVRQYLTGQRQVFRESACAKNPHRLVQIRDQDDNRTAAVKAILALEERTDADRSPGSRVVTPGVVVIVGGTRDQRQVADMGMIELNPGDDASSHMEHKRESEANPLSDHAHGRQRGPSEGET